MTDANSHTTTYAYDALNRLISTTDPLSHVTGYGYDAVGNRTSQTKPDGTGHHLRLRRSSTGWSASATRAAAISYAYDAVGNRTTMTDATGTTTYTYDALDRLTQVTGTQTARWATATTCSATAPASPTPAARPSPTPTTWPTG